MKSGHFWVDIQIRTLDLQSATLPHPPPLKMKSGNF